MKMFKGQIEWEDNYVLDVYQNHFIVYDSNRNKVYYENSYGEGIDNRKKTVTLELTEEQIKQVRELIK